jgi:hypothetical protein
MSRALARVGDQAEGTCNAHKNPRHFVATITTGSSLATCDGLGIARVGDTGVTDCGHHIQIVEGSTVATVLGVGLARVGDSVIVLEGGSGTITTGSGGGYAE